MKCKLNKKQLLTLYIKQRLTQQQIANHLNMGFHAVRYYFQKYKIKGRRRGWKTYKGKVLFDGTKHYDNRAVYRSWNRIKHFSVWHLESKWHDYGVFYKWSMENGWQDGAILLRINKKLGFRESNTVWYYPKNGFQLIPAFGKLLTLASWSEELRIPIRRDVFNRALKSGLSVEEALMAKPSKTGTPKRKYKAFGLELTFPEWKDKLKLTQDEQAFARRIRMGLSVEETLTFLQTSKRYENYNSWLKNNK